MKKLKTVNLTQLVRLMDPSRVNGVIRVQIHDSQTVFYGDTKRILREFFHLQARYNMPYWVDYTCEWVD